MNSFYIDISETELSTTSDEKDKKVKNYSMIEKIENLLFLSSINAKNRFYVKALFMQFVFPSRV